MAEAKETMEVTDSSKKRKRNENLDELEVDVNAPEPPSKKQLRKAKKIKAEPAASSSDAVKGPKPIKTEKSDETKNASQEKRSPYGIWIGNLSFTTTKDDLLEFMTNDRDNAITKEQITRVHLPLGQPRAGKPQNKGFAYIDFSDETSLARALEQSERLLAGRRVLIKDAKNYEGRPAAEAKPVEGKAPSRKIFVGNLSFDTNKDTIEEHFSACGTIAKVQVATFEDSGKCKGYGWIEFEQLSSAQSAMRGWVEQAHDGVRQSKRRIWLRKMNGRELKMEYAEDPTTRYNKRFGKNAKTQEQQPAITEVVDGLKTESAEAVPDQHSKQRTKRDKKPSVRQNGYAEDTVKKMTGAIVEAQGQKVVFT